jgi:hypothetical protein
MADNTNAPPTLRYEDRPDLLETFVDNVQRMTFDGRTLRIEFCVNRLDDPTPAGRAGRSIPICRLVLDLDGAVDLFNKVNSLQAVLENRGVIRKDAPAPVGPVAAPEAASKETASEPSADEAARSASPKKK